MKICFLSTMHRIDDNRIFHKEARSLAEAGYEVFHLAPGEPFKSVLNGVHLQTYSSSIRPLKCFLLWEEASKINADCYHCNEIDSWILGCLIKVFHKNKKIIFDVHEYYPSKFEEDGYPKWVKYIGGPFVRFLYRLLSPITDHVVFAKRSVAQDFLSNPQKQSFIFNYAPLWLEDRKKEDVSSSIKNRFSDCPTAIHIGGFSKIRGWPKLLKALTLMRNKNIRIISIGPIDEGKEKLFKEAQRLGVAHQIQLIDQMPYTQMFDYLLCANFGLMLYQPGLLNHVYAFPIKMYDYMLAGLPIVGPKFAIEVAPIIQEERNGLLIDTSDTGEIAQSLDWLCEHSEEALSMGQRGRQAIIRKYNWETEKMKLMEIYNKYARHY